MELDDWQKEVLATAGDLHIRAGRQVGKSTIVSQKAVQEAIGFRRSKNKKELVIMVIAFTERQAYLLFEKILYTMEQKYPDKILRGKDRPTKHALKLKNGARILCLPTGMTGFGIMGYSIDLLIVDRLKERFFNPIGSSLCT